MKQSPGLYAMYASVFHSGSTGVLCECDRELPVILRIEVTAGPTIRTSHHLRMMRTRKCRLMLFFYRVLFAAGNLTQSLPLCFRRIVCLSVWRFV